MGGERPGLYNSIIIMIIFIKCLPVSDLIYDVVLSISIARMLGMFLFHFKFNSSDACYILFYHLNQFVFALVKGFLGTINQKCYRI